MKPEKIQHFVFFILLCLFSISHPLTADVFSDSGLGYSIDLPEGFKLVNARAGSRYVHQHTLLPVGLQIAVYPYRQFKGIEQAAEHITSQLNAGKRAVSFLFQGNPALTAHISFTQQRQKQTGWLLVLPLAEQRGWLVVVTTAPAEKAHECEPVMISALDAVFLGRQSFFEPGPMMQAVYPKTGAVKSELNFNGKKLPVYFDGSDSEANQAIIDREFAVLTLYLNSPLQEKAWKRYYRMIYRDSWSRCRHIPLMLEKELIDVSQGGKRPPAETTAAAVLEWLQGFAYKRNENGADFLNLPAICRDQSGDCDSRALLMALILQHLGIDSILMIAPQHKHAVAAVDCAGEGARFTHNGTQYLIAETTAQVPMGRIAQEFADPRDWFAVDWYR
ncbi:MAG: hypothetical protein P1P65_08335 [Treponema sp.]